MGHIPLSPLLRKMQLSHLIFALLFAQKIFARNGKIQKSIIKRKGIVTAMAHRERQHELKIYLSKDEQYVLEQKFKISGMKSKSAFIRHLILYGYVYDVNYEHLREYNTLLSRIGSNLNQIAKRINQTGNLYEADVKEVKELMNQVWQLQKSMLSRQPSIKQ
nr:MAG TPA: DNA border endonuclease [Caudoviricetes sp.]